MHNRFLSLALAGLLSSAGFAALAQTPPAGTPDGAAKPMMGASGPMGGQHSMRGRMDPSKMEAMMAKRHDALKAKLKLTPEQEGAWTTFTAAMKPPARTDFKRPDRAEMDKLTTPERIDKMRALRNERMTAMNAAMEQREDAIKTFYGVLSADQKKVFDAEHARMGAMHGEHHGPRGGRDAKGGDKPAPKQ